MRVPCEKPEKTRIEIIPVVDVIVFLLVFFMIPTLSMSINRELPVPPQRGDITKGPEGASEPHDDPQGGVVSLNREAVTRRELGPRVETAPASEPEVLVILNADGEVRQSTVIGVTDELLPSGVSAWPSPSSESRSVISAPLVHSCGRIGL